MEIEDRFKKKPVQKLFTKGATKVFAKKEVVPQTEEQKQDELNQAQAKIEEEKVLKKSKETQLQKHRESQIKLFNYMGSLGNKYLVDDAKFYPEIEVHLKQIDGGQISAVFVTEFHIDEIEKNAIINAGKEG